MMYQCDTKGLIKVPLDKDTKEKVGRPLDFIYVD